MSSASCTGILALLCMALLVTSSPAALSCTRKAVRPAREASLVVAPMEVEESVRPAPAVPSPPVAVPTVPHAPIPTAPTFEPDLEVEAPPAIQLDEPDWASGVMVDPDVCRNPESESGPRPRSF